MIKWIFIKICQTFKKRIYSAIASARIDYEISSLLALTRLNLHKHKTHILANNKSEILQKYYTEILQNNQRLTPIAYIQLALVGQRRADCLGAVFADDSVFF